MLHLTKHSWLCLQCWITWVFSGVQLVLYHRVKHWATVSSAFQPEETQAGLFSLQSWHLLTCRYQNTAKKQRMSQYPPHRKHLDLLRGTNCSEGQLRTFIFSTTFAFCSKGGTFSAFTLQYAPSFEQRRKLFGSLTPDHTLDTVKCKETII